MPIIITRLSDESVVARDTAAWFVGRACDIVPEAAINENYFEKLLVAMVQGLQVSFSMDHSQWSMIGSIIIQVLMEKI